MTGRPVIVISATRFFQGGTLVIVNECLKFLSAHYSATHTIKALVHNKALYESIPGIDWVEFPHARTSVFNRLYDEYIKFGRLSRAWQPVLWLSLQDSTPRVSAQVKAVYYHNPLLLKPKGLQLWKHQPKLELLRLLYKYVYTKGLTSNDFIITQQSVIAAYLLKAYTLPIEKIWIFPPTDYLLHKKPLEGMHVINDAVMQGEAQMSTKNKPYTFIFPATAFYYKNHALILAACQKLVHGGLDFKVLLTIDGSENRHVQKLVAVAKKTVPQIEFLGFLKREALFNYYQQADCMVFPSFLESWGLPLTEFAELEKPILCADLPYGRSTMAGYPRVCFFDPQDAGMLAAQMEGAIKGRLSFTRRVNKTSGSFQQMTTWKNCFDLLLNTTAAHNK